MDKYLKAMRRDAQKIFTQALAAVQPQQIIAKQLTLKGHKLKVGGHSFSLLRFKRLFVAGCGKASAAMAAGIEKILGPRITAGLINVKYGHAQKLKYIRLREAGHPLPDENGLRGTQEMTQMLSNLQEDDLVIFLISGGGSALLPAPIPGITLQEKQKVTDLLLASGATIQEINTLRKHLSFLKGGGLAKLTYPATLISLILSDVVGDPLDAIASGPTVPDPTTFADCRDILDRYNLWTKIPPGVAKYIRQGLKGQIGETLKEGAEPFKKVTNIIVGNNLLAMKAAQQKAQTLGYHTLLLSSRLIGETKEVAKVHTAIAKEVLVNRIPMAPPACILSGGETTVTLQGKGKGGRNQEFALAAALDLEGWKGVVILSAGTDGTDGPTDAAGAFADGETVWRAKALGMEAQNYLAQNNSYPFFKKLGDLLFTGPTGTNVMDLRLILIKQPSKN
ncbi:MAG: glycerate kinase type-2 family protein [Thermodesulfobacteriota bacterium]